MSEPERGGLNCSMGPTGATGIGVGACRFHGGVGMVLPEPVEEALNERKIKTFLRLSGIVGGDGSRAMLIWARSGPGVQPAIDNGNRYVWIFSFTQFCCFCTADALIFFIN